MADLLPLYLLLTLNQDNEMTLRVSHRYLTTAACLPWLDEYPEEDEEEEPPRQ